MTVILSKVDDYLDVIKTPMDFDKMLYKLDNGDYSSAQSFLDDIDLVSQFHQYFFDNFLVPKI